MRLKTAKQIIKDHYGDSGPELTTWVSNYNIWHAQVFVYGPEGRSSYSRNAAIKNLAKQLIHDDCKKVEKI